MTDGNKPITIKAYNELLNAQLGGEFNPVAEKELQAANKPSILGTLIDRAVGTVSMTVGAFGGGSPSLPDGYRAGREASRYLRTKLKLL